MDINQNILEDPSMLTRVKIGLGGGVGLLSINKGKPNLVTQRFLDWMQLIQHAVEDI